jgi:hypothetical protein
MDREMTLCHLAQCEDAVALGDRHIARQRAIIEELSRDGHDATQAYALLKVLEESQVLHVGHRGRLLAELADDPPS